MNKEVDDYFGVNIFEEKTVTTQTTEEKAVDEIDKLVSLAEKVSENLADMNTRVSDIKLSLFRRFGIALTILFFSASYFLYFRNTAGFSFLVEVSVVAVCFSLCVTAAYSSVVMWNKLGKLREDIKIEESVLSDLLNIIHEMVNAKKLFSQVNSVDSALIKMRLKRLHFAVR